MQNIDQFEEIPKYKKKSTHKTPTKSKHKHLAEPCVIAYSKDWHQKEHLRGVDMQFEIEYYCPICGKLMGLQDRTRWYETEVLKGFSRWDVQTDECKREMNPATRTLPFFKIDDPFAKFVPLAQNEADGN